VNSETESFLGWRSACRAVALVYVPQLAALVVGPLNECDHCIGVFAKLFAILPGMLCVALLSAHQGALAWVVAGAVTLGVLAAALGILRVGAPARQVLAVILALASATNAVAIGYALRA